MRSLKLISLSLALFLSSCSAPIVTPTTAPTIVSITSTLPPIETPAPTATMPQPSIEPTKPIEFTPQPIASPRPQITSTPQPITITLFTIEPKTINPGDAITITWRTTGGQVNLFPINPFGQMSLPYQVDNNDSMVIITDKSLRNSIQYMLNVHDARLNKDLQAFASAVINCPDVWFFPGGPSSCPQSPAITGTAAIQHFEHGIMIWFQPRNSIIILYSDEQYSPKWDLRQDNYVDGQPESDPTLIPPKGKYQPVRGFGLVWRDEDNTIGFRVRDRLGWAIDEEEVFIGALQCNSAVKYTTCYLKDDRSRTIELKPERSAWNYYPQP
jgi:hypothetical protein